MCIYGGVCIYVRIDLSSFDILSIGEIDREVEQIWYGISRGELKIIVVIIVVSYRMYEQATGF